MRKSPKILIFSGSTRSGSYNSKLADAFLKELTNLECETTRINLSDYEMPLYNGDDEAEKGIHKNAEKLAKLFDAHDGIIIASPEYNGSITPLLKNTIDWVSRVKTVGGKDVTPYKGKLAAIAAASPGRLGGMRMLPHLRDILSGIGMLVISEQLSVASAGSAFDDMDQLTDERTAKMLKALCASVVEKANLLS